MRVSVIVPVLNEAEQLRGMLEHLLFLRHSGCDVVLVDGGSQDGTLELAQASGLRVLNAARGRARQMNAGANAARGGVLLFLHADTRLPETAIAQLRRAIDSGAHWGRFDVQLDSDRSVLRLVAWLINRRSRLTGIATGDQAIFVRRTTFEFVGRYPDQPLMEDIELSRRLKKMGRPANLRDRVTTSARRWETHGVWRTIFLMWRLRLAYWRGVSPDTLAESYTYI